MRKLLEQCPACAGELVVTQQTCRSCGTMGALAPPGFWASTLAVGVGGAVLLALTLAPPPVRRELARP